MTNNNMSWDNRNIEEIKKQITTYIENHTAEAEAWSVAKVNTKKNGEDFATLARALENCKTGVYIVGDAMHPYLTINYHTNLGGYQSDHLQAYHYLDELPETDARKANYKSQFMRQTAPMTTEELNKAIKEQAEQHREHTQKYKNQLELVEKAYNAYSTKCREALSELIEIAGSSTSLYYEVKKKFNSGY